MGDVLDTDLEEDAAAENLMQLRSPTYRAPQPKLPVARRAGFFADPEDGNILAASFRRDTTIGNLLSTIGPSPFQPRPIADPDFNPMDVAPDRHEDNLDKYIFARNQAEVDDISARLDSLKKDQQLMAQHPWKSFAASFVTQPIDPANWLPGGVLFNNYRKASRAARAAASAAVAGVGSALLQEAVADQTDQIRTTEESLTNVVASGILSGALGGLGAGVSARNRLSEVKIKRAEKDIVTELLGDARTVSEGGTLPPAEIKKMPEIVQPLVNFNPLNRLINSPFETANKLASRLFQHNYQALENAEGLATQQSIEANIKLSKRRAAVAVVDAQNVYFEMAGVKPGIGGRIRANLAGVQMSMEQFSEAVSYVLTTGERHENTHINKAADILEKGVFEPFKKQAIALGLLPENVTPKNARNYFMIVYNKQKILEEGKGGPFVQKLTRFYGEISNQVGEFRKSTFFRENRAAKKEASHALTIAKKQLKATTAEMNRASAGLSKRTGIPSSLTSIKVNSDISKLEKQITSSKKLISRNESLISKAKESLSKELAKIETDSKLNVKSLQKEELRLQEKIKLLQKSNQVLEQRHKQLKTPKARQNLELKARKTLSEIEELKGSVSKISNQIKNTKSESIRRSRQLSREAKNQISLFEKQASDTKKSIKSNEAEVRTHRDRLNYIEARENVAALEKERRSILENVGKHRELLDSLNKDFDAAVKPEWLDSKGKLRKARSDVELRLEAEQTRDKILGNADGHLLNPQYEKFSGALSGKPLKERTLLIDQTVLRDYQLTDAFKVANMHSRAMAPIIELTRAARDAGFKTLADWRAAELTQLKTDFDKAAAGKTGNAIKKLDKQFKSAVIDINAGFEMLQGIYGPGPNTLNNTAAEYLSKIKQYNGLRMLGMMTLSSIPDVALQVFRNGPMRFIQDGLMGTFSEARKIAKQDLRGMGYGVNTWLGTAARLAIEHEGLTTNPGVFSKTFDSLADNFGNLSFINQWNDWNQQMAGHIAINRFLSAAHAEKMSAKDTKRLASLGLTPDDIKIIRDKTVGKVDTETGARFADWTNWEINSAKEARALDRFQKAVANEIDSVVIEPGLGDKPLASANPLGSLLFQFKSFLMSATNKILISGAQRADEAEVYAGAVGMLALGGLSHVVTSFARGQEPKEDFGEFAVEAIDKSGLLGVYMEAYNLAAKFGVVPGSNATRYSSRDAAGALLGPSFGTLSEMIGIVSRFSGLAGEQLGLDSDEAAPLKSLSTRDAETLMRLMPYQNLFYLYRMNKAVTQNAALAAGWDDRTK